MCNSTSIGALKSSEAIYFKSKKQFSGSLIEMKDIQIQNRYAFLLQSTFFYNFFKTSALFSFLAS